MMVILIGYRAAGKSTVGRLLSRRLRIPFADSDQLIESAAGMTIRELVAREGWKTFREKEAKVIASLREKELCVLATGGGALLSDASRLLLKEMGFMIYLKTPLGSIVERLEKDAEETCTRPQFTSESLMAETIAVMAERIPVYEAAADFTVDTADKSIVQVGEEIYAHLLEAGIVADINKTKRRFSTKRKGGSKNGR